MGRMPETVLMHYFNNLFTNVKLFIETISSYYFRQILLYFYKKEIIKNITPRLPKP